jgi:type IV fimbrial biogenesis protein FimT
VFNYRVTVRLGLPKMAPMRTQVLRTQTAQRGFTLLELMVTVTVLAVLLGLAVPSFVETVRNNRLITQTNEFVGALNYTRSEALKRANPVTICSSTDGATCAGSASWSTGWVIFVDTNRNGTLEGGETLLQSAPAVANEFTLESTARTFVQYTSTGTASVNLTVFNLKRPGCTGNHARRLTIPLMGRVNTETVAC